MCVSAGAPVSRRRSRPGTTGVKALSARASCRAMRKGLDVGIHLRPGLPDEGFVAFALGNLAAYDLGAKRHERLGWQVLRVEGTHDHHYRLVVRHPERWLDVGFERDLAGILDRLSDETVDDLRARLRSAQAAGLNPVALRTVQEEVDFWQDDFWNWIGGPSGFAPP